MQITIADNTKTTTITLEEHITPVRQVIWIGAKDDAVYNTIIIDTPDTYQCSITFDSATGVWTLRNGQVRTECPRGLKSNRMRACSVCPGCCINLHTANPTYSLRTPKRHTLINGAPIPADGIQLHDHDTISLTAASPAVPPYQLFCQQHTDFQFDDQGYIVCNQA